MSQPLTISSLTYISPTTLKPLLLSSQETPSSSKLAIIDVRDSDHLGGHITTSIHTPINQLDARMPELLRQLDGKEKVVFHCMLSQQRGPKAALAYARARKAAGEKGKLGTKSDGETTTEAKNGGCVVYGQEICVLEGGFNGWMSKFGGEDKRLVEGYVRELWDAELV